MIKIRKGIFETNSSSIHALSVGQGEQVLPTELKFNGGEFGWEHEVYRDTQSKADYLCTGITYCDDCFELRDKIINTLSKYNINATFPEIIDTEYGYKIEGGYYYIDHGYEVGDFIREVVNDESLLMNFLFCEDSFIETGNDNDDTDFTEESVNCLLYYKKGN